MTTTNDPVSDLLTRIRNAKLAKKRYVELKTSRILVEIVKVLKANGFIEEFLVRDEKPQALMRVYLKYTTGRQPVIQGLRRVSSPSCRRYVGYREIPYLLSGLGRSILSTPNGVMDDQEARKQKVGGELLCQVW